MPVIRTRKTNHNFLFDVRLSFKARGVLAYIFEHGPDWEVHTDDLVNQSDQDGRIAVQSALQELVRLQYATLDILRDKEGKVRGKQYSIYDVPLDMQYHRDAGNLPIGDRNTSVNSRDNRKAGNLPVGTEKQENRQTENLPVGTEKQENHESGNLLVGESEEIGVDTGGNRQAGFMTVRKHDSQETCSTKNQDLENKEKPQDLKTREGVRARAPDVSHLTNFEARFSPSPSMRCPTDFVPNPDIRKWAQESFSGVDFDEALGAMKDYEFQRSHSDWNAVLKTWIRREARDFAGRATPRQQQTVTPQPIKRRLAL